jgi:thiosulfate dehydrogenase (quinone) large subunit
MDMNSTATTMDVGAAPPRRSLAGKIGVGAGLALRYLYGIFFMFASYSKWSNGMPFSDRWTVDTFQGRLLELDPEVASGAIGIWFLENFGLPYSGILSVIIVFSWTAVAIGLLLGLMTRAAALLGAFICVMIGVGGFYDASLIPLVIIPLIIAALPTGHWFGLDRRLHRQYPNSIWFK